MIKEGGGVIHLPTFYIKKFIEDPDLWLSDWSAAKTFFIQQRFPWSSQIRSPSSKIKF